MTTEKDPTQTDPQADLVRARLKRTLGDMNTILSPYAFEIALARVVTATERHGNVTTSQVEAIVEDVLSSSEILQGVAESFR